MNRTLENDLRLRPEEQSTVDSFESQRKWVIRGAAALAMAGLLAALLGTWMFGRGHVSAPSELGDYVAGTAGPLWALAGVLLVYLAFVGQRVQLVYQQAELRATRTEFTQQTAALEGQQAEMERQVLESRRQTFDNAFFQMLRLYNDILAETAIPGRGRGTAEMDRGRDAFVELVSRHWYRYEQGVKEEARKSLVAAGDGPPVFGDGLISVEQRAQQDAYQERLSARMDEIEEERSALERRVAALAAYRDLYTAHQHEIGHYFRTLYHVVKFVDAADAGVIPDKQRYASIVRSQLSSPELKMLAFNGLTHGREKFKPMMERYGMLKQMPTDSLIDSLRSQYATGAFQSERPT